MIEFNKTYKVRAKEKKSIIVTETYLHDDERSLWIETVYRNGEFLITPRNEDDVSNLEKSLNGMTVDFDDDFTDWEFVHVYDECSKETGGDDEIFESGSVEDEEQWAIANDFKYSSTFYIIVGGLELIGE